MLLNELNNNGQSSRSGNSVLLVDDHALVTETIGLALVAAGFSVVGVAANGYEAIQKFSQLIPEVAVLDVGLPGMDGFDLCREIRKIRPECVVILLTGRTDEKAIEDGLRSGANAMVPKSEGIDGLITAIRRGLMGDPYERTCQTRPSVTELRAVAQQALDPLTIRERQVLHLIAEGMSINEVGDTLQLSVTVVETIRSQIMQKLNMDSVALLVQYAMQNGLIPG